MSGTPRYSKEEMTARIREIVEHARHVRIDPARLEQVAARMPASVASRWHETFRSADEHYRQPLSLALDDRDYLQFVLVAGSQGWLIWQREADGTVVPFTVHVDGKRYLGPSALTACHVRAIRRGQNILDPAVLAQFTMADVEAHYRDEVTGKVTLQLLEDRLENFREVGRVLRDEFGGHFLNVLQRAGGYLYREDGQGLIQLLETRFPKCFGDWPMAKLPHVEILNLLDHRAERRFAPEIDRLLEFKDVDRLEGGADYYRPWFFLRVGLFAISEEFKSKLCGRELIPAGSELEREYRAMTIQAVRELEQRIGPGWRALLAVEIETHAQAFLRCRRCRVGISDQELPCAYRPICKATHDDHGLMECGWPLVLTTEY